MTELIIGGSSGLGLEMARRSSEQGNEVIVTGRHDPDVDFATYREVELGATDLPKKIGEFVAGLPTVNSLVYAAGFYQEGVVTDLSEDEIETMISVGGRGLIYFSRELLQKQGKVEQVVTITSTSQWVPRKLEPIYNFVKAGAAHFSHGLSLDERVGKTLVVGPSGMKTSLWRQVPDKDTSKMMEADWVAGQIEQLRKDKFSYRFAKILGASGDLPHRVEIIETV